MPPSLNDPNAPWNQPRWRGGTILPSKGDLIGRWVGVTMLLGMWGFMGVIRPDIYTSDLSPVHFTHIFGLIGLLVLPSVVLRTFRYFRFRQARLVMRHHPAPIGGLFEADLLLPTLSAPDSVEATLINIVRRRVERNRGSKTRIRDVVLHQSRVMIPREAMRPTHMEVIIPIRAEIPSAGSDESESVPGSRFWWTLRIRGKVPGRDLELDYEVPVYRLAPSDMPVRREMPQSPTTNDELPSTVRVTIGPTGERVYTMGPSGGFSGFLIWLGAFAAIGSVLLTAATYSLDGEQPVSTMIVPLLAVGAFGCVSLLIGLIWLMIVISRMFVYRVSMEGGILNARVKLGPFRFHYKVPPEDFDSLRIERMASHSSDREVLSERWAIRWARPNTKSATLIEGFATEAEALRLLEELRREAQRR